MRKNYERMLRERGLKKKEREEVLRHVLARPREDLEQYLQEQIWSDIRETVGVYSLSAEPRDILMWSHYSANHSGICLQYEVAQDPKVLIPAFRVRYPDDDALPAYHFFDRTGAEISNALLSKHKQWSYEKEFRIVEQQAARTKMSVSRQALSGVIVGCAADPRGKQVLFEILSEREDTGAAPVRVFEAVRDNRFYALRLRQLQSKTSLIE